jgi:hypothetical protein
MVIIFHEVIFVPMAALSGIPAVHATRDRSPIMDAIFTDKMTELLVFVFGESAPTSID